MITTINPEDWKVEPIKRISPSRFSNVNDCTLREIWSSNKKENLMGNHPDAVLGSIIHMMFENYVKSSGNFDFENVWSSVEKKFINDNLDVVPLSKTSSYYWVKKELAKRYIEKGQLRTHTKNAVNYKAEEWLESKSKKVGGIIDLIRYNNDQLSLMDFKTGKVYDNDGRIKENYEIQLKLYAALSSENKKTNYKWPDHLFLIDKNGKYCEIKYSEEEASKLLLEAETLLDDINKRINSGSSDAFEFAVTGEYCSFCQFRPACVKFREQPVSFDYLEDIYGEVIDIKEFSNGNHKIYFKNNKSVLINAVYTSGINNEIIELKKMGTGNTLFLLTNCIKNDSMPNQYKASKRTLIFEIVSV